MTKPIAHVVGYYEEYPLIQATDNAAVLPRGMALYDHPAPEDTALTRLLRIMGTFDLATGHASSMDEALGALESELRDVLGYYRTAKPVAWVENLTDPQPHAVTDLQYVSVAQHERGDHLKYTPLYTHPANAIRERGEE